MIPSGNTSDSAQKERMAARLADLRREQQLGQTQLVALEDRKHHLQETLRRIAAQIEMLESILRGDFEAGG